MNAKRAKLLRKAIKQAAEGREFRAPAFVRIADDKGVGQGNVLVHPQSLKGIYKQIKHKTDLLKRFGGTNKYVQKPTKPTELGSE